jgi:hypothetical protein
VVAEAKLLRNDFSHGIIVGFVDYLVILHSLAAFNCMNKGGWKFD